MGLKAVTNTGGGSSGTPPFGNITSGTNTNALVVGTGGSLTTSGSGTITATSLSGPLAFNSIGSGTNTTAAMVVGSGASLAASGTGTITATASNFSGEISGTNTTAAMLVGSGASLAPTGTGTIVASSLNSAGLIATNSYVKNLSNTQLPTFIRKMGGVKVGLNNCRVATIGDSVTLGLHSSATANQNVYFNYMSTFQRYASAAGITSQRDTMWASGDGTNYLEDSRITKGSAWATSGATSLGGNMYTATTNTNALSFAPTGIVDTFTIYYATIPSAGSISINIDGGSATVQSTAAANGLAKVTVSGVSPGIHTCNITWSSGGGVFIMGVEAYNSKISQLQIMTTGWGGATTANVTTSTNAYSPLEGLTFAAPDLTIIATGINDWNTGANLATFQTNYQTLITTALLSGDCVALTPPPTNPAVVAQATQDAYVAVIKSLAASNNIPVIDIYGLFRTWTISSAMYFDNLHPNGIGQEVIGEAVTNFFNVLGGASSNPPTIGLPLLIQTVANNTYTYLGRAGCAGTILGIYEKARALTTAGTFAIAINGTNVTGLSAVVPSTAGSYTYATALNTFSRGDQITITYAGSSVVLDDSLTLDLIQPQLAL